MKFAINITVLLSFLSLLGCTNANVNISSLGSVFSLQAQIRTSAPQVVSSPFKVYVQFTEPVQSFSAGDVVISNATLLGPVEGSGSQYSFTVVPSGEVSIVIPAFQVQSVASAKYNFDPAYLNIGYDAVTTPSQIRLTNPVVSNLEGNGISTRSIQVFIDTAKPYDVVIPYRIVDSLTTMPSTRHTLPATGAITIPAGSLSGSIGYNFFGDTAGNDNFQLVVSLESTNTMKAILQENVYRDSIIDDDVAANVGRFDSVSLSQNSQCRINHLSELYCWGENSRGEVGVGDRNPVAIPTRIDSPNLYSQVSVSEGDHTCAVTTAGILKCWGYNFNGQLGIGSTTDGLVPIVVGSNFRFVSTGTNHTCALTNTDQLACWGSNTSGQVGDGTTTQRAAPITIGADAYITISAGFMITCGVTSANELRCWGNNTVSQLGLGDLVNRLVPVTVDGGINYSEVTTGYSHACAIVDATDELRCWGSGSSGQIGDGATTSRSTPVIVDAGVRYTFIDAGQNHTCGVTDTNVLKCWGRNDQGQLGTGTLSQNNLPIVINPSVQFQSVSAAANRTCAITSDEKLQCWGNNANRSFSFDILQQLTPREIADSNSYQQISASPDSTWGISNQNLYVWGAMNNANLGPVYHVPRRFLTPETPAFIAASSNHQCFISTHLWGD